MGHPTKVDDLRKGIRKAARVVATSYGPSGFFVALNRVQGLLATKDGYTIAHEVRDIGSNPVERLGALLGIQASKEQNQAWGDGTTTTLILLDALLRHPLKDGWYETLPDILDVVDQLAVDANEELLLHVAKIASNHDESFYPQLVEACLSVGEGGFIAIEDGKHIETKIKFVDGMQIEKGWGSTSYGFCRSSDTVELERARVAIFQKPLMQTRDVVSVMECASTFWQDSNQPEPLTIFAPSIVGDALKTILLNNNETPVYLAIEAPGVLHRKEEHLRDLASVTGATLVSQDFGMDPTQFKGSWFGTLRKIHCRKDSSILTFYPEHEANTFARINLLKATLHQCISEYEKDLIRKRIAALSEGQCKVLIGGFTELEMKEKRGRVEDTLKSIQAALKDGVVPGGGIALYTASEWVKDTHPHLAKALQEPFRILTRNNLSWPKFQDARERDDLGWVGWDTQTEAARDFGTPPYIVDAKNVVKGAVEKAFSLAHLILNTEAAVLK